MTTDWSTETKGVGKYAEINGLHLYYKTLGSGTPLMLLHGGLGSTQPSKSAGRSGSPSSPPSQPAGPTTSSRAITR